MSHTPDTDRPNAASLAGEVLIALMMSVMANVMYKARLDQTTHTVHNVGVAQGICIAMAVIFALGAVLLWALSGHRIYQILRKH